VRPGEPGAHESVYPLGLAAEHAPKCNTNRGIPGGDKVDKVLRRSVRSRSLEIQVASNVNVRCLPVIGFGENGWTIREQKGRLN
jgi:hypothetical protein